MRRTMSRRQFLKSHAGVGLVVTIACGSAGCRVLSASSSPENNREILPLVRLTVSRDETVTVEADMSGFGPDMDVYSSISAVIADELEADWKSVRLQPPGCGDQESACREKFGATGPDPGDLYGLLRLAGAAAREMLTSAAAKSWNVPVRECSVLLGKIRHLGTNRMLTYGQVAGRAARLEPPGNPRLKKEALVGCIWAPANRSGMDAVKRRSS